MSAERKSPARLRREADAQVSLTKGVIGLLVEIGSLDHVAQVAADMAAAAKDMEREASEATTDALDKTTAKLDKMTKGRKPGSTGPLVTALVTIMTDGGAGMSAKDLHAELVERHTEGDLVFCFDRVDDDAGLALDQTGTGKIIKEASFRDAVTRARKILK